MWNVESGKWNLESGIWKVESGIWNRETRNPETLKLFKPLNKKKYLQANSN